jgi:cellulose synthase/poly-beta-1,6-N-acetylglucosamine synthase-like glycosyltransferase
MSIQVSIIIPFQKGNEYLVETLHHIRLLDYKDIEVILLPDEPLTDKFCKDHCVGVTVVVIPTGHVSPAIKRDMGAERSKGEFLAFIDDDAYPQPNWLSVALPLFSDPNVCGAGGPQLTPPNDTFWQKVSGAVFLSGLNGTLVNRYYPGKCVAETDDWPSVNLLVRKSDFLAVGGFDSAYWPGEDTKLCLDLTKQLKKRILYSPEMLVFHHRRAGFLKHLKQTGNYGLHRGHFARRLPETSFRLSYMIPSMFFLFVVLGWMALFMPAPVQVLYGFAWFMYIAAIVYSISTVAWRVRDISIAFATAPYTVAMHFWYGARFLQGFFLIRQLNSRLGR